MTQDILITPGSGEPQILFRGSGTNDTPIELNVLSSYQSASGSGTALLFEGQEGQLFAVTDNLSSGTIFSVGDITGLSMLSVDASGDVKLGEFANSVIVYPGLTLDDNVPSTTSNVLYNDGGDLMWNGVVVLASDAAQAINGSGTASYVARFTDSNTLSTGVLYDNGTNVGIGTTSPARKLHLYGDTDAAIQLENVGGGNFSLIPFNSSNILSIYDETNAAHRFVVDNNGNIGINVPSPYTASQKLDIRYPAGGGMALLKSTDTTDGLLFGDMAYSTSNTHQGIKHAAMTGGDDYMILSDGTNTWVSAKAGGTTVIAAGGNSADSHMKFSSTEVVINENSSNLDFRVESNNDANALFVDGVADNVGIGTASPLGKLHIVQNNSNGRYSYFDSNLGLFIKGNDNTAYNLLTLENTWASANFGSSINFNLGYGGNTTTAGTSVLGARVVAAAEQTMTATTSTQDAYLALHTTQNGTPGEKLRVTSAGNVGIGTASPLEKLHVVGNINIVDGWLNLDNDYGISYNPLEGSVETLRYCLKFDATNNASYPFLTNRTPNGKVVIKTGTSAGGAENTHFTIEGGDGTVNSYFENTNVGIGTTSPQQKLHIDEGNIRIEKTTDPTVEFNNGSANRASVFYDTSEETFVFNHADASLNQLVLTSGNNVGIGTNDPNSTLHVYSATSGDNVFNVEGTNGSLFGVTDNLSGVLMSVNTIAGLPVLEVNSDYSVTAGRFNQNDFTISSSGNVGIGKSSPNATLHVYSATSGTDLFNVEGTNGSLFSIVDSLSGSLMSVNNIVGLPIFEVFDDDTVIAGRYGENDLYVSSSGNVGLGTASPTEKLHVEGNIRVSGAYYDSSNSPGTNGQILSSTVSGTDWVSLTEIQGVDGTGGAGQVAFWSDTDTISGESNLYWDSTNNRLGIGTTSPSEKLHVAGNLRLTGAFYDSNNAAGTSGQVLSSTATGTDWISLSEIQGVDGTGTAGQVAFWSDADTITGESNLYWDSSNDKLGIGTASPVAKLHVNSSIASNALTVSHNNPSYSAIAVGTDTYGLSIVTDSVSSAAFCARFRSNGGTQNVMFAGADGRIGIGTETPARKLQIDGDILFNNYALIAADGGSANIDHIWHNDTGTGNAGGIWHFVSDGAYKSNGNARVYAGSFYGSQSNQDNYFAGNVGIGTTSPRMKLNINGGKLGIVSTDNSYGQFRIGNTADNEASIGFFTGLTESTFGDGSPTATHKWAIGLDIYGIGTNKFGIGNISDNTSVFTIQEGGNVGIGTTSPAAKLDVDGQVRIDSASAVPASCKLLVGDVVDANSAVPVQVGGSIRLKGGLLIHDNTNVDRSFYLQHTSPNGLRIYRNAGQGSANIILAESVGNVGIGALTPQQKLHIDEGNIRIENSTDPKLEFHDGAAVGAYVKFDTSEDNLVLSHVDVAGDNQLVLANDGNVGIGTASPNAVLHAYGSTASGTVFNVEGTNGSLFSVVDNLSGVLMSVNNNAGLPVFEVYDDDSIIAGRFAQNDFVITASGDVGIGTASPAEKLHVVGDVQIDGDGGTIAGANFNNGLLKIGNSSAGISIDTNEIYGANDLYLGSLNAAYNIVFRHGTTERMRIASGGNVGVGITVPTSKLHVVGDLQVDNLNLNGNTLSSTNTNGNIVITPNGTGGIAAGTGASVTGSYAVVGGGCGNTVSTFCATVSGGGNNCASGSASTVSGGGSNCATANLSTIGGGSSNTADGIGISTISGGTNNTSSGYASFVGGGKSNCAIGFLSTVSGGYGNCACGRNSSVSGGYKNFVNARHGSINGGHYNVIQSPTNECCRHGATIGGGVGHNTSGGTVDATTGDITGTVTCCGAGRFSTIGGGLRNCATAYSSTVSGGDCNNASGSYSTVGGGYFNNSSACFSTIIGGLRAKATRYGEVAHAAGRFAQNGDAQHTTFVARYNTTDATANVELFLDGNNNLSRMILPAETTWTFDIKLSAYNDTDNTAAWWIFRGGIRRNAANGTTLIGSLIEERDYEGTMSGTSAAVTADDTNESLKIAVTGLASKNIRWVAVVDVAQVSWGTP